MVGNITNGLEIPLIVMRSIYPDFFHIQGGAKSFFRLFDMYGGGWEHLIQTKISSLLPNKMMNVISPKVFLSKMSSKR